MHRVVLSIAAGLALLGTALAQDYPTKPITLISPFAQGASSDIMARQLADGLAAALGQKVSIKNVPGKSGVLGVSEAAKAEADGHTLVLSGDAALTTATVLYESVPYDPETDFEPISRIASAPNAILAAVASPHKSLADLVRAAKDKPGQLKLAHAGIGFSGHVGIELLKQKSGINVEVVLITALPDLQKAVAEGTVDAAFMTIPLAATQVKEGKVRAIAVTGPVRTPALADVPTFAEAGIAGYDASAWFALLAPKGTPQPVITRLHGELVKILARPEVQQSLSGLGFVLIAGSPEELKDNIKLRRSEAALLFKDVARVK